MVVDVGDFRQRRLWLINLMNKQKLKIIFINIILNTKTKKVVMLYN